MLRFPKTLENLVKNYRPFFKNPESHQSSNQGCSVNLLTFPNRMNANVAGFF